MKYFIAYHYQYEEKSGTGNCEVHRETEITGINDLKQIARAIEENNTLPCRSVVVINFVKF